MHATPPASITANYTVKDFQGMNEQEGVTIKVCAGADKPCAAPLDTQVTDAMGKASVTLTPAVKTYLDLSGGAIVPTLFFNKYFGPLPEITSDLGPLLPASLDLLIAAAGATKDDTRGHAGITVLDCLGAPSAGASIAIDIADANTTFAYFEGGLPTKNTVTSAEGLVGIANLPPGTATVTAKVDETGASIGEVVIEIRVGSVSGASVVPD